MNWLLAGAGPALGGTWVRVCACVLGIIEGGACVFEWLETPTDCDCAKALFDFIVFVRNEGANIDDDGEVTDGGGCSNGLASLPPRPSIFDGREKRSEAVGDDENKFSALFVFISL